MRISGTEDWDIFYFSEIAVRNSTKLDKKQDFTLFG